MAGMEQLQIHSRSYLLRWVNVKEQHVISWSIQPQKKGINFGIFKHPGPGVAPTPKLGDSSTFEAGGSPTSETPPELDPKDPHRSLARDKLKGLGYRQIHWHGFCEPNQVTTGTYDVGAGDGGMYALVLDNTFAKSFSKIANLALLVFPSNAGVGSVPLMSHLSVLDAKFGKGTAGGRRSSAIPNTSVDLRPRNGHPGGLDEDDESKVFQGVLHKRRRKKGQGYARRFFSLDLESSTLAYYHDRNSSSIRGIIPLALAAIGANEKTREISIDSGAEVWHLRAGSAKDFEAWEEALEKAASMRRDHASTPRKSQPLGRILSGLQTQLDESVDLTRVEDMAKRMEKARNVARQIAKDTDPKYFSSGSPSISRHSSDLQKWDHDSDANGNVGDSTQDGAGKEKKSWWRKGKEVRPQGQRTPSGQSNAQSVRSLSVTKDEGQKRSRSKSPVRHHEADDVHEQCMLLLRNLDSLVADMQALIDESQAKRRAPPSQLLEAASRLSMESSFSQEFFDAEGGEVPLLTIHHDEDERPTSAGNTLAEGAAEGSSSEIEDEDGLDKSGLSSDQFQALFPTKPKNFNVSTFAAIIRRKQVAAPKVMPPSLIGFLRKNVGKDLSTVSMPVSANEPLSLTQKAAEVMEYSELLDNASESSLSKPERLLYVTAFAISGLANLRLKERAIRKPFNPMLGETFEMIREDKGYRFVAEKVSHRPVILACQADSEKWSLSQSPVPTQKFWGKSAELITEGRVRLSLHGPGEQFSWAAATCFLRNIIAGEKYVEPVGTMTVTNESTGQYATVTFKAKGMFSGRSEEVAVQTYDNYGDELPLGMVGKWTHSLTVTENGEMKGRPLWMASDLSPPDAARGYGFTSFAASLNEISPRDRPHLPPTDSRLRPDQRALEDNDVDTAEELKAKLEEAQRARRKEYEEVDRQWTPQWFHKIASVDGEDIWGIKRGKDSYWEHRAKDDWKGVVPVLEYH